MPKGQAPDPKMKGLTPASMRTEVKKLYQRIDASDKKIESSTLLRIKRKLQNITGLGGSERKTLLKRIEEIEKITTTKKQQNEMAKG
jgi:hypothetical protein|tara:strand:+ start:443 stop:703 length:261 start_codon:yes stop_codon:yes gene_type:complete